MRFFPHEEFYIKSNISRQEAQQRLIDNIDQPKTWWNILNPPVKYFIGFEVDNEFEIKPNINYRNDFIPQLNGVIEADGINARIYIKMALQPMALAIACLWLGFAGLLALVATLFLVISGDFSFAILIPYGMFFLGYFMIVIGFTTESEKAKKFLTKLFNGNIENV